MTFCKQKSTCFYILREYPNKKEQCVAMISVINTEETQSVKQEIIYRLLPPWHH